MPLIRRVPKRGFKNFCRKEYSGVNLSSLSRFEAGSMVTPEELKRLEIARQLKDGIKILGQGEIKVPLTVKAHKFSKSAREKIINAGGKVEVLE